jgi:SNF2 family DNA or RNA helicase
MGPRQHELYMSVVKQVRQRRMIPIEGLQKLIEIASHPELFQVTGASLDSLVAECPKLQKTLSLVEGIRAAGEKVVIFTRYRRMQQILQNVLSVRFGIGAAILNGEVAGGRRMGLVDRFNESRGFGAMILSPEAAGVGLNIVGANHVIHYTRLWNPAKENQATDRVHRIGQTRPVTVYCPIVTGGELPTVEERLHVLLEQKQALARDVVRPRETLSVEKELLGIFDLAGAA